MSGFTRKRAWLSFLFVLFSACSSAPPVATQDQAKPSLAARVVIYPADRSYSILQGLTHETGTQITAVVPKKQKLRAELHMSPGGEPVRPAREERVGRAESDWEVLRLRYEGLKPGQYVLTLRDPDTREIKDQRVLRTLDRAQRSVKVAITSCSDDHFDDEQRKMWPALLTTRPDLLFMIGDNVYVDWEDGKRLDRTATPELIWRRYASARNRLWVFRAKELVPILATWDDHDYGMNDGDRTYVHREESKQIFKTFFAQEPMPGVLESGPGVSSRFNGFGQRFYLMDDRSFRSPNIKPGSPNPRGVEQTHWGTEQEDWLYSGLERSRVPTWVINGDQFFGAYHPFESYAGNHPESFQKFLAQLKKASAPVFLVSGDRHLVELMKIPSSIAGLETYELTTSGVHAKMFPGRWKEAPNPFFVHGADLVPNFGWVESTAASGWQLDVRAYGPGLRELFRERISIWRRSLASHP